MHFCKCGRCCFDASQIIVYDERGNETESSFFATDGDPVSNADGFIKYIYETNNDGEPITIGVRADGERVPLE